MNDTYVTSLQQKIVKLKKKLTTTRVELGVKNDGLLTRIEGLRRERFSALRAIESHGGECERLWRKIDGFQKRNDALEETSKECHDALGKIAAELGYITWDVGYSTDFVNRIKNLKYHIEELEERIQAVEHERDHALSGTVYNKASKVDELEEYKERYPPDFIEELQQTIDELKAGIARRDVQIADLCERREWWVEKAKFWEAKAIGASMSHRTELEKALSEVLNYRSEIIDKVIAGEHLEFITHKQIDAAVKMANQPYFEKGHSEIVRQHTWNVLNKLGIFGCEGCGGSGTSLDIVDGYNTVTEKVICPACNGHKWIKEKHDN